MRYFCIIFLVGCFAFACVKSKSKDPIPTLEFKEFQNMQKLPGGSLGARDTGALVVSYTDGDGDLFVNTSTDASNLVIKYFNFITDSNKFVQVSVEAKQIKQPDNGYYKGKSIKGDIYIPIREYRKSDAIKLIKVEVFMVDMKSHQTNIVTSPTYTINY